MIENQLSLWDVRQTTFGEYGGCYLHDEAMDVLTDRWQRLGGLKSEKLSSGVFEDLVFWGFADFLVESVGRVNQDGEFVCTGCRQWYRLGTGIREGVQIIA